MFRAMLVSLIATLLIGGMLYYTLKRSDVVHSQQRDRAARETAQQEALAVSRAFSSISGVALVVDVAKVQEALAEAQRTGSLADVIVMDHGNRVLAASAAGYVGQQIQDPNWPAIRAQNREILIRDEPTPGQERITVVEPIQDKGATIAWARLTFVRPFLSSEAVHAPRERVQQVARLLGPVFLFLVGAVGVAMRLATARMQQRIQSVVTEAMVDTSAADGRVLSFEEAAARTGAGSRKAA